MTARINAAPVLDPDSLQFSAFEKIRCIGADRADGQTLLHNGAEWHITAHAISTVTTVHVVLKKLNSPSAGYQQAMAIIDVVNNGYRGGPDGLALLLPALHSGIQIAGHPLTHSYRVLPCLEVPGIFTAPSGE